MSAPADRGRAEIAAAARRIAGRARRTPVIAAETPAGEVLLKLETLQATGAFKVRGALAALTAAEVPEAGVVAASGGNHGAAVAFAARALGLRAEIFVPEIAAPAKVARIRAAGAEVVVGGAFYADAREAAAARRAETGALDVPAFDHAEVIAGQGTLAREFEMQAEPFGGLDAVLVAVGGGGLIAGTLGWLAGAARVAGVETPGCRALAAALEAGAPAPVEVSGLAADSLGAPRLGALPFAMVAGRVEAVEVTDDDVRAAQAWAWDALRIPLEPGGAAALAGLLSGRWIPRPGERVGVVLCGANLDARDLP